MGLTIDSADLGKIIYWLVAGHLEPRPPLCDRCGHGAYHHRLDDAANLSPTDPAARFRCVWPRPDGPSVQMCDCPDWTGDLPADSDGSAGA